MPIDHFEVSRNYYPKRRDHQVKEDHAMTTFHYQCRTSDNRPGVTQAEQGAELYADPPALADKYFFERPAILELASALKPGDHVRMAYEEVVPLVKALCILQDWHDRLDVEIEFFGPEVKPGMKTFRGLLESGVVIGHILNCIEEVKENWRREDEYEAMCN
jgi:hypothetical protein